MASLSVFSNVDLFTKYAVTIEFQDKLLGGVPKDPSVIEGWIRAKAGVSDQEEIRRMMLQTLLDLGEEVPLDATYEQLVEASKGVAVLKQTNGFKRDEHGLYIEDRQVKALIKEAVNILYAGDRWGRTKKGPKSFTAERVFVDPAHISLGKTEPDGIELQIIHVTGPRGAQSSLAYHEYVTQATLSFTVKVCRDEIMPEHWREIWTLAQDLGLGACRSQSFGRFDVTGWDPL